MATQSDFHQCPLAPARSASQRSACWLWAGSSMTATERRRSRMRATASGSVSSGWLGKGRANRAEATSRVTSPLRSRHSGTNAPTSVKQASPAY